MVNLGNFAKHLGETFSLIITRKGMYKKRSDRADTSAYNPEADPIMNDFYEATKRMSVPYVVVAGRVYTQQLNVLFDSVRAEDGNIILMDPSNPERVISTFNQAVIGEPRYRDDKSWKTSQNPFMAGIYISAVPVNPKP